MPSLAPDYVAKFNLKVWRKATLYVAEPLRSEPVKSPGELASKLIVSNNLGNQV